MNPLIRRPHWRYVLTLTFALVAPAATSDEAACQAALAEYYAGHDTPHDVVDAYAASKAGFDDATRKGNKASIAAFRFDHEMRSSSGIVVEAAKAINEAAKAINVATAAASDAGEAAEAARALWSSIEAGASRHSALEAVAIEHTAFMSTVSFVRAGRDSVEAFFTAVFYATSGVDRGKVLDVLDAVMDAGSVASIYEALADFEATGIAGIDKFIGAFRTFHDAGRAAVLSAQESTVTLEMMGSFAACQ